MFSLKTALGLAAFVAVVLVIAAVLNDRFGSAGIIVAAALSGLADVHSSAATVASFVASSHLSADAAQLPLLIAISTNTVSKMVMAGVYGSVAFWAKVIPGLLITLGALWAVYLWT